MEDVELSVSLMIASHVQADGLVPSHGPPTEVFREPKGTYLPVAILPSISHKTCRKEASPSCFPQRKTLCLL